MGHLDADRVKEIVRFFWSRMEWDIRHFISNICSCLKQKKLNITKAAPLKTILSAAPTEPVSIDFLNLDTCTGGCQYLLVNTDNFSRFAQAYRMHNREAKTAIEKVYTDFILRFELPR